MTGPSTATLRNRPRPGVLALMVSALTALAVVAISCSTDEFAVPTTTSPPAAVHLADRCPQPRLPRLRTHGVVRAARPDARPGQMPAGSTMAEIQTKGRLVVGNAGDVALFGFRNATTGRLEGFDIDVLREIAKAIFGPGGEDKIEYRVMNFAQRLPSLEDRSVDLVAHTMTINCARWNRIGFSSTYFDAGQRVLIRAGAADTTIDDAQRRLGAALRGVGLDE